jgi:hypothetical protein
VEQLDLPSAEEMSRKRGRTVRGEEETGRIFTEI